MGEAFNFKREGSFVEIGSADGMYLNNTFLLEQRLGWRGLCIEPNPDLFRDLSLVRSSRCLQVCLDLSEGEVSFALRREYGGIISDDTDNRTGHKRDGDTVVTLRTTTLVSVLDAEAMPRAIDYCSVDVEGAEQRVLSGFPFERYTFRTMTIERPGSSLTALLSRHGYVNVREIPQHDVFFVHESFLKEYEANLFRYWGAHARPALFR
jgi:FkbM family methyltransferase